jgi:hypothetical protein
LELVQSLHLPISFSGRFRQLVADHGRRQPGILLQGEPFHSASKRWSGAHTVAYLPNLPTGAPRLWRSIKEEEEEVEKNGITFCLNQFVISVDIFIGIRFKCLFFQSHR